MKLLEQLEKSNALFKYLNFLRIIFIDHRSNKASTIILHKSKLNAFVTNRVIPLWQIFVDDLVVLVSTEYYTFVSCFVVFINNRFNLRWYQATHESVNFVYIPAFVSYCKIIRNFNYQSSSTDFKFWKKSKRWQIIFLIFFNKVSHELIT